MSMFCYQCEQTAKGTGCTAFGVCGKDPRVAALQDVLVHLAKGIAQYAHRAATLGKTDPDIDHFILQALFTTVTNVNFDPGRILEGIHEGAVVRLKAKALYEAAAGPGAEPLQGPAAWEPARNTEALLDQAAEIGIQARINSLGETVAGLQELLLYGLKGTAAYMDHAVILGKSDPSVAAFFAEALSFLSLIHI